MHYSIADEISQNLCGVGLINASQHCQCVMRSMSSPWRAGFLARNLLLTLEQFWNGSMTVFVPPLNDSLVLELFLSDSEIPRFLQPGEFGLSLCPSPYNSLHPFIQTKLYSRFLVKSIVHPKLNIVIIYSLLFIFETKVALLDAQEQTSLVRISSMFELLLTIFVLGLYILSMFIFE